jgi:hypothetical protein
MKRRNFLRGAAALVAAPALPAFAEVVPAVNTTPKKSAFVSEIGGMCFRLGLRDPLTQATPFHLKIMDDWAIMMRYGFSQHYRDDNYHVRIIITRDIETIMYNTWDDAELQNLGFLRTLWVCSCNRAGGFDTRTGIIHRKNRLVCEPPQFQSRLEYQVIPGASSVFHEDFVKLFYEEPLKIY